MGRRLFIKRGGSIEEVSYLTTESFRKRQLIKEIERNGQKKH